MSVVQAIERSEWSYPAINKSTIDSVGLSLPGEGRPKVDCGRFGYRGCLNREGHLGGKVVVQKYHRSCNGRDCPTCVKEWARLSARRVASRLASYRPHSLRGPVHVIVSPPEGLHEMEVHELRKRCYAVLKHAGLSGGVVVFHPLRRRSPTDREYSPHFHVLGYGYLRPSNEVFAETGWVYKNKGQRSTVFGSVWYLLSHAGFKPGLASTSWYGTLSYNKYRGTSPVTEPKQKCRACGASLRELFYSLGEPPFPDREMEVLTYPEGWDLLNTKEVTGTHRYDRSANLFVVKDLYMDAERVVD